MLNDAINKNELALDTIYPDSLYTWLNEQCNERGTIRFNIDDVSNLGGDYYTFASFWHGVLKHAIIIDWDVTFYKFEDVEDVADAIEDIEKRIDEVLQAMPEDRCKACNEPLYGMVRVHHHTGNGQDATQ